FLITC
ncbi:his Kinase A domain protein, partial [Vibrio parahaemolyticus V-223/04]